MRGQKTLTQKIVNNTMKKTILITETQLSMLKHFLTEVASGYDDYLTMKQHGGVSLEYLIDTLYDLKTVLKGIFDMTKNYDFDKNELIENLELVPTIIDGIIRTMNTVFTDFTDVDVVKSGQRLHRKLELYQKKIKNYLSLIDKSMSKQELLLKLHNDTMNLSNSIYDYVTNLMEFEKSFRKRIDKSFRRPTWN